MSPSTLFFLGALLIGCVEASVTASTARHAAKVDTCKPSVSVAKQHRFALKHRPWAKPDEAQAVTVRDMLKWEIPIKPRGDLDDPREARMFAVTGIVKLIKLSEDDCDLHLEIADVADPDGPRVVVEIPADAGFTEARRAALTSRGRTVVATGYAFWDSAHWSEASPFKGHNHAPPRSERFSSYTPLLKYRWPFISPFPLNRFD